MRGPTSPAARPDVCALANNHALDFGHSGLIDTLDTLTGAGIAAVGAGYDAGDAARPAIVELAGGGRVIAFSFGTRSSGISRRWAATERRPGVRLLRDLSETTADEVVDRVREVKRPADVVVASIHWGSNWGYDVPAGHVGFARRLVDGGVDIVHGCGDFIDDYEGISGYEDYRDDLRLAYFAATDRETGHVIGLRMAPMQAVRMRLHHASRDDAELLATVLDQISGPFGARVGLDADGMLHLWSGG